MAAYPKRHLICGTEIEAAKSYKINFVKTCVIDKLITIVINNNLHQRWEAAVTILGLDLDCCQKTIRLPVFENP